MADNSYDYHKKYIDKYIKKTIKPYTLKLNRNTDSDMIDWLDSKEKYSVYIKDLIKADMKKD